MSRLLEKYQINIWMYGYSQIQGTRSKKDGELRDKSVPYFQQESVPWIGQWRYTKILIWYFSNNLDIYDDVGKLPEQHLSVWLFSNPGDNILFLLKLNEARISEWNITKFLPKKIKYIFVCFPSLPPDRERPLPSHVTANASHLQGMGDWASCSGQRGHKLSWNPNQHV